MTCFFFIALSALTDQNQTIGQKVEDKIYVNLQSDYYCVRRLNLTHQIGCTSQPGGNVGVVWTVNSDEDIQHVLTSGPTPPYIVVLNRNHFTSANILKFKKAYPARVSGVILIKQNMTEDKGYEMKPFSTDSTCPNKHTGLYSNDSIYGNCQKQSWQIKSDTSDLFFEDIPFPIFLMTRKESVDKIMNCFETHNYNQGGASKQSDFPLCSAQLDSFMAAASNSEYCLYGRSTIDEIFQAPSSRCRPINKNNIFGYYKDAVGIKPANSTPLVSERSIVLITTRMDSISFFNHPSPGADSAISGLVVLLAVSHTLAKFKTSDAVVKSDRNIAFAIFDAESLDYTGSGRMAYDMKTDRLFRYYNANADKESIKNTNLKGIDSIIELNQLALYPKKDDTVSTIFIHTDPQNYKLNTNKLGTVVTAFKSQKGDFKQTDVTMPLPPSSIQSFIRLDQEIAGLVLTNHQKEYTNLLYHSIFDDRDNINRTLNYKLADHLTDIATAVARVSYITAFGKDENNDKIFADKELVKKLLECYLIDSECDLVTSSTEHSKGSIFKGPVDTYDSSYNSMVTQLLLSYFLADKQPQMKPKECEEMSAKSLTHRYIYVNGDDKTTDGVCIKFQVLRTPSLSPTFQYDEVELNETMAKEFSTWTESDKRIRNPVRLFFRPSPLLEWVTFISGLTLTVCSFVAVSFVKKSILKQTQTSST